VRAEVSLVGTVGADAFGESCLERLSASGVRLDHVRIEEVFDGAAARGIRVSFDPNIRPQALTHEAYAQALRRILGGAHIVLASEGELQTLLGEATDADCAAQLTAGAAEVVVIKRGARGASLFLPDHGELRLRGLAADAIDPTGAGDCFGGTFLALYLGGMEAREALQYANVAGAMAVQRRARCQATSR